MDFESAKAHVRAAGIQTVGAFWIWSRTCRPAEFPSDPRKVYGSQGWSGFPDFFGKTKNVHRKLSPEASERRIKGVNKLRESAAAGDVFVNAIGRHAPGVVFLRVPRGSGASLLFRLRQPEDKIETGAGAQWCANPSGLWWGIRVRTTTRLSSRNRVEIRVREGRDDTSEDIGLACVSAPLNFLRLVAPDDVHAKRMYRTWKLNDTTPVSELVSLQSGFPSIFDAWTRVFRARPFLDWLSDAQGRGHKLSRDLATTLDHNLFAPSGLNLTFPRADDFTCNMVVGGKRLLHRSAKTQLGKPGYAVGFYHRNGRRTIPFVKESSNMDAILVSLREGQTLLGCFVYSKADLAHCFSSDSQEGCQCFTVYTPKSVLRREKSQNNRADHLRFFVDLCAPVDEYVPRFRELFERATRASGEESEQHRQTIQAQPGT